MGCYRLTVNCVLPRYKSRKNIETQYSVLLLVQYVCHQEKHGEWVPAGFGGFAVLGCETGRF